MSEVANPVLRAELIAVFWKWASRDLHDLPYWAALALVSIPALSACGASAQVLRWQSAVDQAARSTPSARILVLDITSAHLLAANRLDESARTLAAPGSAIKPLVLYGLVTAGRWDANRRIRCSRHFTVGGHRLECSHPDLPPLDAREALAWSCNSYFGEVARGLQPGELAHILRPTGLLSITGLASTSGQSRDEAIAEFHEPRTSEENQLAVLGVEGVRVTPLELAEAYRWLSLQLKVEPESPAAQTVVAGLRDSATFGMAAQASLGGVSVAGKTGTAEGANTHRTHGWFAGLAPAENPRVVVVVYLPNGRGADAARVAAEVLAKSPLVHR